MFIADFHIHSKYSRATSAQCVPEFLEMWARRKGLDLIGTGDFTHPAWREELKEKLVPSEEGLYALKDEFRREAGVADGGVAPRFIVSGEISSIYKKNGRVRKVHNLILLPSLEAAATLSGRLEAIGNLHSDGRPILGLDSRDLLEITLGVCPEAIFIPAHIWTPHFSLFGAYSGFDSIEECFGDLTSCIPALETGLSSDPPMNWRLSALDRFLLVSNSDAHSPGNLAREANLFDTTLSYPDIARALRNRDSREFYGTIEFFPEEGKYHWDGHRACKVCMKPEETRSVQGICPACGGRITVGVLSRVEALADRAEGFVPPGARHFERLVPLPEVVASSMGSSAASLKAKEQCEKLIRALGPELYILRQAPLTDIEREAGALIAEGIRRLRCGKVEIQPGYDGEYGKVTVLSKGEIDRLSGQLSFLPGGENRDRARAQKRPARPEGQVPQGGNAGELPKVSPGAPNGLNPEQWEAASAVESAVLVVAGPGTGKTKTLVGRIAHLVEARIARPGGITAVTFTNKAAGEMRARLEGQLQDRRAVEAMTIGTFHAICLKILSERGGKTLPVIDESDALSIVKEALDRLGFSNSPREVLRGISLTKSGLPPAGGSAAVPDGVYDLYNAQLARCGVWDYDDILLSALELFELSAPGDAADGLWDRFSHLLIDEFQDINPLQYRLIRQWTRGGAKVFAIGDPNQSIYGFRGSDPRCFTRFLEDWEGVREVRLTQNYRSTPEILRCAQSVIPGETGGLVARRESGPKVRLLSVEDAFSEALFVAGEINRMVGGMDMLEATAPAKGKGPAGGQTRGFSDIAVLYRTNRQSGMLEECLGKEGIPYTIAGRDEFLSEPEARRSLAFFRFLLNPEDLAALRTWLKGEGCPAGTAQQILENCAATSPGGIPDGIDAPGFGGLPAMRALFRKYAPLVRSDKPRKLIECWMKDAGLTGSGCMEMLLDTAVMYDGMPALLQNLTLGRESDLVRSGGRRYSPDAVSLMTLHGAKGLEFPVVFLCGITEELMPFRDYTGSCNPDEERRIFYVGMTRARDELVVMTPGAPSPFLAAFPRKAVAAGSAFSRGQAPAPRQFSFFDS